LKKFSIILVLMYSLILGFSYLVHIVDLFFVNMPLFYQSTNLVLRFGELIILFAFIGFFISTFKFLRLKFFSICFVLCGFIKFFAIEFSMIEQFGVLAISLMFLQLIFLMLWILELKNLNIPNVYLKGYMTIGMTLIYIIALIVISLLPYNEMQALPRATETILPFFSLLYLIGIWLLFKEWYREAFVYKNMESLDF
jgi:hypothetical protein